MPRRLAALLRPGRSLAALGFLAYVLGAGVKW